MFYLLRLNCTNKRRGLARLFTPKVSTMTEKVCGMTYCVVAVRDYKVSDWNKVVAAAGPGNEIILPKGVAMPHETDLFVPDAEAVRRNFIIEGALTVLEDAAMHGAKLKVALLDKDAKSAYILPRLMQSAAEVTVFTKKLSEYDAVSNRLFDALGASPVVTDDSERISDCSAVIAPNGISGCGLLPLSAVIFSDCGSDCVNVSEECIDRGNLSAFGDYDIFSLIAATQHDKSFKGIRPTLKAMRTRESIVPLKEISRAFYS